MVEKCVYCKINLVEINLKDTDVGFVKRLRCDSCKTEFLISPYYRGHGMGLTRRLWGNPAGENLGRIDDENWDFVDWDNVVRTYEER